MKRIQSDHISSSQQAIHRSGQQTPRVVWQDKTASKGVRIASRQPGAQTNTMSTHRMETKNPRKQKRSSTKRRTVHVALWVKPGVKEALQRIAQREQLSVSATGAAFLEQAIESDLHQQHAALLEPLLNQAIRRSMRAYSNRLVLLLVRVAFASEQTRAIVTNILSRQPGVTPDLLTTILDGSSKTAKRNITARTPQLEELITELKKVVDE